MPGFSIMGLGTSKSAGDKKGPNKETIKSEGNETLSYKSLKRHIVTMHPTDPETNKKLSLFDSVTVNKFGLKFLDAIGCLQCFNVGKKCFKTIKNKSAFSGKND